MLRGHGLFNAVIQTFASSNRDSPSEFDQAVVFLTCVRGLPGSNLGRDIDHPELSFFVAFLSLSAYNILLYTISN
jgi:hypothetical protein